MAAATAAAITEQAAGVRGRRLLAEAEAEAEAEVEAEVQGEAEVQAEAEVIQAEAEAAHLPRRYL